jgi:sugar phosphate isomerase/epimerase
MPQKTSRREFLVGTAAFGCNPLHAAPAMRLSLSVRVAEAFDNKEKSTMSFGALVALAQKYGYDALCMRASQAGIQTSRDVIQEMRRNLDRAHLPVSMVTGDFAVPSNNDQGPGLLRKITPYLDLAEAFGARLIRVCMKKDEDIVWAQRASDEAKERNIRLAHQSHCASLFETVDGSLRVLKAVDRPNFGIIYEPANWLISAQDYGRATIHKLKPYLFNVYVQNHRLAPKGKAAVVTWTRGKVPLDHIGVWEEGGVDFGEVFAGLRNVNYQGYVTVHQAFGDVMPVEEAVRKSAGYLRKC